MDRQLISDVDRFLFQQGRHFHIYRFLGAHPMMVDGVSGVRFALWAPHAQQVWVVGDFNHWQEDDRWAMRQGGDSGLWQVFIPEIHPGCLYKYKLRGADGQERYKADPCGVWAEFRPHTASIVCELTDYPWEDMGWQMHKRPPYQRPLNIYEVHLGSWRKRAGEFFTFRELAAELVDYVGEMGYTHVELLPLTEHPYDGSWGYQGTGFFSVTSRYGTPHDFMFFVDRCHQKGIGVILDWVPGHFCTDEHGLRCFDGTFLYEYQEEWRRENREWGTAYFDLGKPEVQSFLISSALFWLEVFHIDGIRVDAVASMLYRDYGRKEGEWVPNIHGGKENLEAVSFLQNLSKTVFSYFPEALLIAEESTAWPLVTKPVHAGGLGFNFKWNMGWMNDMLRYVGTEFSQRKHYHHLVTFSFFYAFAENFVLPLSHDEVVHGKKSLLNKMPGSYTEKFAGLRVLLGYLMAHPGKKLLFMGGEYGQFMEWRHDQELDWGLLEFDMHKKLHRYVKFLNHYYAQEPNFWLLDNREQGFAWIDPDNRGQSVLVFLRQAEKEEDFTLIVCNFLPVSYAEYQIGVPAPGAYFEALNSDEEHFGGTGQVNTGVLQAKREPWHNQPFSLKIKVPGLAILYFKPASNQLPFSGWAHTGGISQSCIKNVRR
ncbi:1,4-alpha-glucan branching protein GlgB [Candidatus Formimonas warabiya]|uniref:1,4-alpha-glucan branching enzyme GlgB n=1 Tax=Formimonas warabiya TaxID=1761012 RepID=A0A3G1L0N5_FORW1|nr:1,4-alpha-glucan branching protein GlgB [Candidatus Formimonas warabiya]ATW28211.1 1,4-alpha-glucan branching enzyme [Candidatus Formimonas warabiya]